jgi:hypothetical protein
LDKELKNFMLKGKESTMDQTLSGTRESMRDYLKSTIYSNKGKFITVGFWKKDGSFRQMNGRTGVKKYLKGGVNPAIESGNYPELITFFDVKIKAYRMINLDTITSIKMEKGTLRVV